MNGKTCATSDIAKAWESIDWNKAEAYVKKLQMRIVKAHQQGRTGRVKSLQWLLTHSFYGRALAVRSPQSYTRIPNGFPYGRLALWAGIRA